MPIKLRSCFAAELRDPFHRREETVNASITAGAFVAVADGRVEAIEREEAAHYIDQRRIALTMSIQRITDLFDDRVRRLQDFPDLIITALQPIASLSLNSDVIGIAERVGAADRLIHPNDAGDHPITVVHDDPPEPQGGRVHYRPSVGSNGLILRKKRREYGITQKRSVEKESQEPAMSADDRRLRQIVNRLPKRVRQMVCFLRQPHRRWLRIPIGALLGLGGVLGFLPILGFWMIPIGLALLADDVQILRALRCRILDWVEGHRPDWIADGSSER
jgi:tellurite resistance protein